MVVHLVSLYMEKSEAFSGLSVYSPQSCCLSLLWDSFPDRSKQPLLPFYATPNGCHLLVVWQSHNL